MTKNNNTEVYRPGNPEGFSLDHDAYNAVSCSARLQEIKLVGSTYSVRPEIFEVLQDLENLDMRYAGHCRNLDYNKESGTAVGRYEWLAEIKSGRKNCLKLKADYLLVYSELLECDAGHVNYFFHKVGRFATYPYFRSHFAHNTSETGLMMPPLPTLRERVD